MNLLDAGPPRQRRSVNGGAKVGHGESKTSKDIVGLPGGERPAFVSANPIPCISVHSRTKRCNNEHVDQFHAFPEPPRQRRAHG